MLGFLACIGCIILFIGAIVYADMRHERRQRDGTFRDDETYGSHL